MSIRVCIHNHNDQWVEMDRACFGFLSHIHCWDCDDVEDHSDNYDPGDDYDGLHDFESANLKSVDYIESVHVELLSKIKAAMAGLPQYYGNVTITNESESRHNNEYCRVTFNIPLGDAEKGEGLPMQPAVIAGMMLRNVCCYTGQRYAFEKLIDDGVSEPLAFTLAQAYPYRINGLDKSKEGFYRNFGGDETIFPGPARLCDIVNMVKGNLGDNWQGTFGDTDNGYGRYGEYDGENAPQCKRSGNRKDLTYVTLATEGWETSPKLNSSKELGCGSQEMDRVFIPRSDMVKIFVPQILEQLK